MKKITYLKMTFGVFGVLVLGAPVLANADQLYRQLEVGSTGSDVGSLQTFLATDPNIYPQGLITNYFGLLTKNAVANFQTRNGLPAVGRVGPATLPVINAQMNSGSTVGVNRTTASIESVNVSAKSDEVTISWRTTKDTSAVIFYSKSPIALTEGSSFSGVFIGGNSFLVHTDLRSSHEGTVTGLDSDTTYNYAVYVKDAFGNESLTWPQTFKTK